MTAKTRLLGVDYGAVRVGLAVCDSERIIASPLAIDLCAKIQEKSVFLGKLIDFFGNKNELNLRQDMMVDKIKQHTEYVMS